MFVAKQEQIIYAIICIEKEALSAKTEDLRSTGLFIQHYSLAVDLKILKGQLPYEGRFLLSCVIFTETAVVEGGKHPLKESRIKSISPSPVYVYINNQVTG